MSEMKKRWIALYVENDVGVLAKVSGLFSGKSYNLQSLTVGTTEDETVSRMTISVASDSFYPSPPLWKNIKYEYAAGFF